MDAAAVIQPEPAAANPPFEQGDTLGEERFPTAFARLEALIGTELAHRLVSALVSSR